MRYEPYAVDQARDVFPWVDFEPAWLIDLGPGFGREAWQFKARWPGIEVIGIEPCAGVCRLLLAEGYPGTLIKAACGDRDGEALLYRPDQAQGSSLQGQGPAAAVEVVTLDSLALTMGPFRDAVLWADVEGSELDVLRGAAGCIGGFRLLNLEVHEGENEAEVDAACAALGFERVLSYAGNGLHHDNVYRRRA